MTTRLLVTADDYGLTEAVSRGIMQAHHYGIVTGTSALVVAPAFQRTASWLKTEQDLDVGVHLAAVGEDPPILTKSEIPTLVDARGYLPESWRTFCCRWPRIDPTELRLEFAAQINQVESLGIVPTHLDTHQHIHLVPGCASVVLDLATVSGIKFIRVPSSTSRTPVGLAVQFLERRLRHQVRKAGLSTTAGFWGLDHAGNITQECLENLLGQISRAGLPSAELNVHPGQAVDPDRRRYAWGYSWGEELAALVSDRSRALTTEMALRLTNREELTQTDREELTQTELLGDGEP